MLYTFAVYTYTTLKGFFLLNVYKVNEVDILKRYW